MQLVSTFIVLFYDQPRKYFVTGSLNQNRGCILWSPLICRIDLRIDLTWDLYHHSLSFHPALSNTE